MNVGIDVSSNNGHLDWAQIAKAGVTFAYARATLGKESNDETFEANRQGAKAHGIRFGAYHLPYPGNSSAKQQAAHFLRVAKPRAGDLLPAIDIENKTPKDEGEAKFSRDDLIAWFRQWLAAVEAKVGAKPIIYTNPSWWSSRLQNADLSGHPLWLAHYTEGHPTIPHPWKGYAIWQHSDRGPVAGRTFDLNRCPNLDAVTIGRRAQSVLVLGAHGPEVVRLKKLLKQWSKAHPPPAHFVENDVFGKNTRSVVKRFQKSSGLTDDGKVGENTWKALQHK